MLAKVWMLFQEWVWFNVEEKRKKTLDVLDKKVIKNLEDLAKESSLGFKNNDIMQDFKETWKTKFNWSIYVDSIDESRPKKIWFLVEIREKTIESTISKALREKDYINQGDIMDLLWIRITTENIEDKIILMDRISQLAFKYWEYRIKNKNWISKDQLDSILWDSDFFTSNDTTAIFIKALEESFTNIERRASTALKYSDIKLVPVWDGNKLSFEILFLDSTNTNSNWLAHHKPFSYMRKIHERVRLEWHIKFSALKRIANCMIEDLSDCTIIELEGVSPTNLMKQMLNDLYYENKGGIKLKNHETVQAMKKDELKYELKRVIPEYYASRLLVFKDSKWRKSWQEGVNFFIINIKSQWVLKFLLCYYWFTQWQWGWKTIINRTSKHRAILILHPCSSQTVDSWCCILGNVGYHYLKAVIPEFSQSSSYCEGLIWPDNSGDAWTIPI